ncbi:hypothetical protein TeGR_g311, partial [Tetraparma gracilis]
MRRGRRKLVGIPRGLKEHINSKHAERPEAPQAPPPVPPGDLGDDLSDLVSLWARRVLVPASLDASLDSSFHSLASQAPSYPAFCLELVRAVERVAPPLLLAAGREPKSGYRESLPPLHALAADPRTTVKQFDARLGELVREDLEPPPPKKRKHGDPPLPPPAPAPPPDMSSPAALASAGRLLASLDRNGSSLLSWSAGAGNLPLLERLSGAPPPPERGGRSRDGKTFLHFAAANGRTALLSA